MALNLVFDLSVEGEALKYKKITNFNANKVARLVTITKGNRKLDMDIFESKRNKMPLLCWRLVDFDSELALMNFYKLEE